MDVNAPFNGPSMRVAPSNSYVCRRRHCIRWQGPRLERLDRDRHDTRSDKSTFFVRLPSIICPINACVFSGSMSRPRHQGRVRPYQTSDFLSRSRRDTDFPLKSSVTKHPRPSRSRMMIDWIPFETTQDQYTMGTAFEMRIRKGRRITANMSSQTNYPLNSRPCASLHPFTMSDFCPLQSTTVSVASMRN